MYFISKNGIKYSKDKYGLYVSPSSIDFDYTDGKDVERYLEFVFRNARDLSTESIELESYIKDWSTEYHLSRKRAQLLKSFDFPRSSKVLEVGCGCGAITRTLAEKFETVISIEGSYNRAKLARLRCAEMDNIHIISAPYQEFDFVGEFDYVFCVGVLEYAGYFVGGENPYADVIASFGRALKPGGVLVLAIENQFGLKYFASSTEDHTNRMFEGIEGYPVYSKSVRTFGRNELESYLSINFKNNKFYYPYPDYKIPDAVLSEWFLENAKPSELLGGLKSRDYSNKRNCLFSESLAYEDISKNNALNFFSNSFLVFSGNGPLPGFEHSVEGVLYSSGRKAIADTITIFERDDDFSVTGKINVVKGQRLINLPRLDNNYLKFNPNKSEWMKGSSIQKVLLKLALNSNSDWSFAPSILMKWKNAVILGSTATNCPHQVNGEYLDCTWKNAIILNNEVVFFDTEWECKFPLYFNYLFIRSAFIFYDELFGLNHGKKLLRYKSGLLLTKKIAASIGIKLTYKDFYQWYNYETLVLDSVSNNFGKVQKIGMILKLISFGFCEFVHKLSFIYNNSIRFFKRGIRFVNKLIWKGRNAHLKNS